MLPDGTINDVAPLFEVATIRAEVPVVSGSTPALVVAGPLTAAIGAAATVLTAITAARTVRSRRRGVEGELELS